MAVQDGEENAVGMPVQVSTTEITPSLDESSAVSVEASEDVAVVPFTGITFYGLLISLYYGILEAI
jgi:hypothetical protein